LLAALDVKAQCAFLDDYAARIAAAYPALGNGRVLFAFRRVFIVATRRKGQDERSETRQSSRPVATARPEADACGAVQWHTPSQLRRKVAPV
jgi:hypothetical protein